MSAQDFEVRFEFSAFLAFLDIGFEQVLDVDVVVEPFAFLLDFWQSLHERNIVFSPHNGCDELLCHALSRPLVGCCAAASDIAMACAQHFVDVFEQGF